MNEPTPPPFAADIERARAAVATAEGALGANLDQPVGEDDRQTFIKVATFLDPLAMGPLFVSSPIRGKIFVGKAPGWQEVLDAQLFIQKRAAPDADENLNNFYVVIGELLSSIYGWLPEGDAPGLAAIRANPVNKTGWPALKACKWLDSRDPSVGNEVAALFNEYAQWKKDVTPTEDEFVKYYGTVD